MSLAEALSVRGLRIELASGLPVVEDISFTVGQGETLALVGESGSGKTTTALALLGYARSGLRITAGEIEIAGQTVPLRDEGAARALRGELVSHVPQEPGASLNPSLRIGAALRDVLRAHLPDEPPEESVAQALRQVNLPATPEFLQRYPHQLSGGQQQRVMIAMALSCRPRLLVLDEPTTGLDVVTQAHILSEIKVLHAEHQVSMVYVSHDLAVVSQVADRIAVMYGGRIVEEGTTEQVLRHSRHPYTRGLLDAVPDHLAARRLHGIPGVAVGVSDRPAGCAYAPRCPLRVARCETEMPPLENGVRCFEWRRVEALGTGGDKRVFAARDETPALLRVEGLEAVHKSHHGRVIAAADVSFSVAPGECLGLVGESGSGKTTIARCVVGLHQPSGGRILLDGQALATRAKDRTREQRRRCQIVFQNPYESLNPLRRVGDQVAHAARVLRGLGAREARAEASAAARARPSPGPHRRPLPAGALGRRAPADRDRPRRGRPARPDRLRRDHLSARRLGAGRRDRAARRPAAGVRRLAPLHHARSRRRREHRGPRDRARPRVDLRGGPGRSGVSRPDQPAGAGAARGGAAAR